MGNIKLTIEYDGTNYAGWQVQPNAITIQQVIQDTIYQVSKEKIVLHGAGRTDAGVHARAQVANFITTKEMNILDWFNALNHYLPKDIRIIKAEEMPLAFHARFSAKGKIYRYKLLLKIPASVFDYKYVHSYPYTIDFDLLKEAIDLFIGEHNFESFSANREKDEKGSKVRNLSRFSFERNEETILFELEADGFLYKMVRMLIGTVLDVAREKISLEEVANNLIKPARKIGPAISPCGLMLWEVIY